MKRIMVMCGTGVATSTLAVNKIKAWLCENSYTDVEVLQSRIMDQINHFDEYDAIVSTTIVPNGEALGVVPGLPLVTGQGSEAVYQQLKEKLAL